MSLLILEDLKKHYGSQEVLRGASFMVDPGAKIGIVGRNGGGKTTLLRMIIGAEQPDWGRVTLRRGARLGHVPQRPSFAPGVTVRAHVESGLEEVRGLIVELERAGERMGHAQGDELERLMKEHDRLTHRIEELGGWETERRAETVLSGIGLEQELWEREARTLSGGEQSRVALARELVAGHDLLLLDEPTNHLDLAGIEWLERYVSELESALLIVSHDRRLLTRAVSTILELERGELVRYSGNYPRYLQLKQERYDSELKAWEQQQEQIKREESFIKKHMGSQRTAEAKGRQKKLSHVERLDRPQHDVRRPVIRPPKAARGGELVLTAEGLVGGYGSNLLFERADVRIGRGQRVGIVGPNGAGKTTLLKILAGRMQPLAGKVEWGHGASCGYYDQHTGHLREDGTPFTEIRRERPEMTDLEVRGHLARFLFRGNEIDKPVPSLSGGERARVALAKLVLTEPSWLAMDEPTNHLDLASRTALEEMLGEYDGALICISHDREFLDGLCDHVIEVGGGTVRSFRGNYSDWRAIKDAELAQESETRARRAAEDKRAERERIEREVKRQAKRAESTRRTGSKAQASAPQPARKSAASGSGKVRNPYLFEKLEKRIIELEERLQALHAECGKEEVYRDSDRLRDLQFSIAELEHELALANEEWANWG